MSMHNVWKHSSGSALFAPLRHLTRWGSKCSISGMELCTQMVSIKKSGCAATNAKTLTTWNVSHLKRKKTLDSLSCAGLMSVGDRFNCKRVTVDLGLDLKRVIFKRVTFSFIVARQKTTKKKVRRAKDGRIIPERKKASAGYKIKEQQWELKDLDRAFDLWEKNKTLPPKERLSMNKISKDTGIPYTTLNERLSGRRGGGRRGKIAGGKRTPKVLKAGKFKRVTFRTSSG